MRAHHQLIRLATLTKVMPDPHQLLHIRGCDPTRITRSGLHHDGYPFRLDLAIDWLETTVGDPSGVRTVQGVHVWAAQWANAWWEWRDAPDEPKPDGDMLTWLINNVDWAHKNYPGFDEFQQELRQVLSLVEKSCGYGPEPAGVSCPTCGAQLHHQVTFHGVAADYDCPDCGAVFTPEQYANAATLAIKHAKPNTLIRVREAALLGVPEQTVYSWIRRGTIPATRKGNNVLVRLGEVRRQLEKNGA